MPHAVPELLGFLHCPPLCAPRMAGIITKNQLRGPGKFALLDGVLSFLGEVTGGLPHSAVFLTFLIFPSWSASFSIISLTIEQNITSASLLFLLPALFLPLMLACLPANNIHLYAVSTDSQIAQAACDSSSKTLNYAWMLSRYNSSCQTSRITSHFLIIVAMYA